MWRYPHGLVFFQLEAGRVLGVHHRWRITLDSAYRGDGLRLSEEGRRKVEGHPYIVYTGFGFLVLSTAGRTKTQSLAFIHHSQRPSPSPIKLRYISSMTRISNGSSFLPDHLKSLRAQPSHSSVSMSG